MFQCVYSIQCLDENIKEFYIGSTDNLKKRINSHKCLYLKNTDHRKLYTFIRENGGWDNWEINYIQKFKFLTDEELREYEQWYIDTYKPELNSQRAKGIDEERKRLAHRKRLKKFYEKNKEKIQQKRKEKIPCPHCNKMINKPNISTHIKTQHPTS